MLIALDHERQQAAEFEATKECNFAIAPAGIGRFRVNCFVQQGRVGMVLRIDHHHHPELRGPAACRRCSRTSR